jgi:hypothetical protein
MSRIALVVAVIAAGTAVWALLRPAGDATHREPSPGAPSSAAPSSAAEGRPGDAKAHVCAAFDTVRNAVSLQTNTNLGPDPVAREAVAGNARLATLGGGTYLASRIDPAAPAELTDAVRTFANQLQDIGIKQLAGIPNTDGALSAQFDDAQKTSTHITDLCK